MDSNSRYVTKDKAGWSTLRTRFKVGRNKIARSMSDPSGSVSVGWPWNPAIAHRNGPNVRLEQTESYSLIHQLPR